MKAKVFFLQLSHIGFWVDSRFAGVFLTVASKEIKQATDLAGNERNIVSDTLKG